MQSFTTGKAALVSVLLADLVGHLIPAFFYCAKLVGTCSYPELTCDLQPAEPHWFLSGDMVHRDIGANDPIARAAVKMQDRASHGPSRPVYGSRHRHRATKSLCSPKRQGGCPLSR